MASVSIGVLRGLVWALQRRGYPVREAARVLSLDAIELTNLRARVSLHELASALERTSKLTGDRCLGLTLGAEAHESVLHVVGQALPSCRSLRAARLVGRYLPLIADGFDVSLREDADTAVLSFDASYPEPVRRFAAELCMAFAHRMGQRIVNTPRAQPLRVRFRHRAAGDEPRYFDHFQCPVTFADDVDAIEFARAHLEASNACGDPTLVGNTLALGDTLLGELDASGPIVPRIRALLRDEGWLPEANAAKLAKLLRITPRQLKRRLAEEHGNFAELIDEARRDLACKCLAAGVDVLEVSRRVGYSDRTALHRSFRRWMGCTPVEYRERYLAESSSPARRRRASTSTSKGSGHHIALVRERAS